MKAADVMTKPVVAATPRASIRDITTQLLANGLSGIPVAEAHGTVLGMITEADIIRALLEGKQLEAHTAQEFMTKVPVTVDVNARLAEVMKLLQEHHIIRVPVTEEGRLVGIISRTDIIQSQTGAGVSNLWPERYLNCPRRA